MNRSKDFDGILNEIDAVLFDRGNVIYDCRQGPPEDARNRSAAAAISDLLRANGDSISAAEILNDCITPWRKSLRGRLERGYELNPLDFFGKAAAVWSAEVRNSLASELIRALSGFYLEGDHLEPDFKALAAELRRKGKKLAVVANTIFPDEVYRAQFAKDSVLDLFDVWFSVTARASANPTGECSGGRQIASVFCRSAVCS